MSAEYLDQIRDVIARLQAPISDTATLLQLLTAPLACIALLPPRFRQYNVAPIAADRLDIPRHIPPFHRALLEHVIPTWEPVLAQQDALPLLEQYFCPDPISFASPAAGLVAALAYSSLLSVPLSQSSIRILAKLVRAYPIDALHPIVFSHHTTSLAGKQETAWEDCVRNVSAVPAKVANALAGTSAIPPELEHGAYFNNLTVRCELLIDVLSKNASRESLSSMTYLLSKLVNLGVFSPSRPYSPSQPSFFQAALPTIRRRISASGEPYAAFWRNIISSFSSYLTLQSVVVSLFSSLTDIPSDLNPSPRARALVKCEAALLRHLLGRLHGDNAELLDCFGAVALGREWSEGHARIFACWAAGAGTGQTDTEALEAVLSRVVDIWTAPDHIKHSLLSRHRYITALLLLVLHASPAPAPFHTLARSPPFLAGVSAYIAHLDPSVRRCGMLVAEQVARGAGQTLDFGDWADHNTHGRDWCRALRRLLAQRDVDADDDVIADEPRADVAAPTPTPLPVSTEPADNEPGIRARRPTVQNAGYDSDDSLSGYASPAPSSRSVSPAPSELAEIERDPTLNVGRRKVARPVYLAQLGELVRPTAGLRPEHEDMTVERQEVALETAEELIRRKRAYGTELEENAVNLVHGFLALQDNYDIERFEEKRQAVLNALVACCPRKAAPTLIEEFFRNQYSTNQRYVVLNALAIGARELASMPLPPSSTGSRSMPNQVAFPSKRLPPALHRKYITAGDHQSAHDPVRLLLDGISREAIEKGKESASDKVPEVVRERRLRIRQPAKVTELSAGRSAVTRLPSTTLRGTATATFGEVAAEYFVCPLINRFWLFLRDEQTREARTMHRPALHQYRGAGTGLVLNAIVLSRFLNTLTVLVHAARNATEWLAIVAPDALELAVTLGTRPVSLLEGEDEDHDGEAAAGQPEGENDGERQQSREERRRGKEAAVLTGALELALIVLDGSLDLDDGRSLGLEHTALLSGVGEWAGEVFSRLEKGLRVAGEGGAHEVRLRRAAAGVLLKVDELTSRWRRSMIDVGAI